MPVGRLHAEFAQPPRLVANAMDDVRSALIQIGVNIVNVFDQTVSEVGVVSGLMCPQRSAAFAKHDFEVAKRKKLPTRSREIEIKAEFVFEVRSRNREIFNG